MSGFLSQILGGGGSGLLTQFLGTAEGATGGGLQVLITQVLGTTQGGAGGIQSLISQFESAGLGEHIKSWVGTGENLPITAEQVNQAIPQEQLAAWAEKFGLPADKISGLLAEVLPHAVDHATPEGTVPPAGAAMPDIASLMGKLMGR